MNSLVQIPSRKSFFDQQLNGSNLINFDTTGTKFNCEYMYLLCNL